MAEPSVTADALPADDLPPTAGEAGEAPDASASQSRGSRNKMLIILAVAVVGGTILGIAGTLMIASLKPAPMGTPSAPAPRQDRQQDALIQELKAKNQALETQVKQAVQAPPPEVHLKQPELVVPRDDSEQLKELKAKNEKLEEQLRLTQQAAPPPPVRRGKVSSAKVAEDCTITDKTEKLGEKLKSCVDGFNSTTR